MRVTRALLVALGLFAVMATTAQGEGLARLASPAAHAERTEVAVVGASIAHPASWTVERERYTFDGTYGFTLWKPGRSQDHRGVPAVRVALAEKLRPSDIDDEVGQTLAYHRNQGLDVGRETVGAGGREGVAFGPIPGSTPATRVYVPVDERGLTSHFSALRTGLSRGDRVDKDTVLGYAGNTGGPRFPVGQVHFHQVFYRYPNQNPDGSPYGGQGLKIVRHHYFGTAASRMDMRVRSHVYEYGKVRPDYGIYCREGLTCGEGYMISN